MSGKGDSAGSSVVDGISLRDAARQLGLDRPIFYGVLLAYGIKATSGKVSVRRAAANLPNRKHAMLLTVSQFRDIQRRLKLAGHSIN